jgi:hypothetical protein
MLLADPPATRARHTRSDPYRGGPGGDARVGTGESDAEGRHPPQQRHASLDHLLRRDDRGCRSDHRVGGELPVVAPQRPAARRPGGVMLTVEVGAWRHNTVLTLVTGTATCLVR